jgi:hypothetical protein
MTSNELKAHILACLITAKLIRESQSGGVVFENKHYGKEFAIPKSVSENNLNLLSKINDSQR